MARGVSQSCSGLPHAIRLLSLDAGGQVGRAFNLRMVLSQVESNVTLDAAVFRVRIPATARPITVEELRQSGPLATRTDGR